MRMTYNGFPTLAKKVPRVVSAILRKTGLDLEAEIKISLSGSRHGRIYKVSKTGKTHQASAPGEAPATDTGNLKGSIGMETPSATRVIVFVGANTAMGLEYGTRRMLARPFVRPSIEKIRPSFMAAMHGLENKLK